MEQCASSAQREAPRPSRRDLRACLLIGLCCLLVYNANGRAITAGDTYPARYLPFAIWGSHTVLLDPVVSVTAQGRDDRAFWIVPVRGGHSISLYPVVVPLLVSPLYLPAVAYLQLRGWTEQRLDHVARVMEKLAASLVAGLSASLLYLLLRRRAEIPTALLLTIAYAFGTTTWVISSQALWQHGIAQVLVIGTMLALTAPCTTRRALAAGLLCGLIASNRPPDVILAALLGAFGLFWAGSRAALLAAAALVPVGLVLLYNFGLAHNIAGGYGQVGGLAYLQHDLLPGLGGLLFSPARGLFVFSPFLLFLTLVWRYQPQDRVDRRLNLGIIAGVVCQLVLYAKADWRGGLSWGPRYMTDVMPLLIWMLVPVVAALRGLGRGGFVLAVGVSIVIEAIGAFAYTPDIDIPIFAVADWRPHELDAAWKWPNAPFIASLQRGRAPAELTTVMRGDLYAIEADGRATSAVTAGQQIVVSGWALAGRATPLQVAVVIDGRQTVASQTFSDRPDVRAMLREAGPAGWRIPIETSGLGPGEHKVAVLAWASARGEAYYLAQRTLTVDDGSTPGRTKPVGHEDLNDSLKTALARLRAHQQAPGYWLTAYTSAARFQDPHQEMNTFLTALLIDLLDPLAAPTGLGASVQRAREHLTGQIEAGGLVRYHGRPDAPGIGTLGCAITPDADDTALVWRIAPRRDSLGLPEALATLNRYRTADGLYRTWLAPREAYQCLDPGTDPNPADIAIQMHVLQWLDTVQPPAGHALCDALRQPGALDQDRLWVYYRKTPLVPILRLTDLQRAGCALTLPESRLRTEVPGQEIWVSAVRLLERVQRAGGRPADAAEIEEVLHALAHEDFALVRQSPPLLYHNDLTGTVTRFYWSEDAGYAIWLRLFYEYARLGHSPLGD